MTSPQCCPIVDASSQEVKEDIPVNLNDPNLPIKSDRLFLYRKIEQEVAARVLKVLQLPDTRRTSYFAAKKGEEDLSWIYQVGCRGRQMKYLKYELMPMVSSCLMLEVHDLQDAPCTEKVEEPIRCITLLISNILLMSRGNYDARLRSVVKCVCVELLQQVYADQDDLQPADSRNWYFLTKKDIPAEVIIDGDEEQVQQTSYVPLLSKRKQATMRFEQIEKCVAVDILMSLVETHEEEAQPTQTEGKGRTKRIVIRTLQVGSVGLVVGGIFAFTGGLAAPALVAAISAFGIGAGSATFATLTTTATLSALFGISGGGMAAYKMKKRTEMLTEWKIRNENKTENKDEVQIHGLHATIAVTGWLLDKMDFQRAWGIMPTDPPTTDKLDLLQRFFAVHGPSKVPFCKALLKFDTTKANGRSMNKKEKGIAKIQNEKILWEGLEKRFGRTPDHLLPFDNMGEEPVLTRELERVIACTVRDSVLPNGKRLGEINESNAMFAKMEAMNDEVCAKACGDDDVWLKEHGTALEYRKESTDSDEVLTKTNDVPTKKIDQLDLIADISVLEMMNSQLAWSPSNSIENGSPGSIHSAESLADDSIGEQDNQTEIEGLVESVSPIEETQGSFGESAQSDKIQTIKLDDFLSMDQGKQHNTIVELPVISVAANAGADERKQNLEAGEIIKSPAVGGVGVEPFRLDDKGDYAESENEEETIVVPTEIDTSPREKVIDAQSEILKCERKVGTSPTGPHIDGSSSNEMNLSGGNVNSCYRNNDDEKKDGLKGDDISASQRVVIVSEEVGIMDNSSAHSKTSDTSVELREELAKKDHDVVVWDWQASYSGELYTVTWETDLLARLCRVVNLMFLEIGNQVSKQLATQTIIGGVLAAVHVPSAIATCLGVIDDPYQLISFRADYAGIELANCLLHSDEHRPVSLVGFSFGARVIFSCLQELAKHQLIWEAKQRKAGTDIKKEKVDDADSKQSSWRLEEESVQGDDAQPKKLGWRIKKARAERAARKEKEEVVEYSREPSSIVEDVCFIGMPRLVDVNEWCTCREIVGGRVVNCYSQSDFFLTYLFQIRTWKGVSRMTAGTHPVEDIVGVENFDVTSYVSTHGRYPLVVPQILREVGFGEPS